MLIMKTLPQKPKILDLINRFPTKTDKQIALETGCERHTVSKYRKETDLRYDSEFVAIVAGKFIKYYGDASNYWNSQITELEELKKSKKIIFKTDSDGHKYQEEEYLDPIDILAICKQQAELKKMILILAGQGEVREVIRIMRSGKIPMLQEA